MTGVRWMLLIVPLAMTGVLHVLPRLSRPGILFGVTVSEAFANGPDARALVGRYRAVIWLIGVVCATATLASQAPFVQAAFPMLVYPLGLAVWQWANRRTRPHALPSGSPVRTASLRPRDESVPGGAWFVAGPYLVLAAAALIIYLRWDSIPVRLPTHWTNGAVDRWTDRSATQLLAPLVIAGTMIGMLTVMGVSLARYTRKVATEGPAGAAEHRFKSAQVLYMTAASYVVAILFSVMALRPAFAGTSEGFVGPIFILVPMLNLAMVVWMLRVGQGGQRRVTADARTGISGDATPDRAWKGGGLLYFNPGDPAIWVEQRIGIGYTVNFGNPRTWLLIGIMALPAVIVPLLF